MLKKIIKRKRHNDLGVTFKVRREIKVTGTSYMIAIPPLTVERLGLLEGATMECDGEKLIIYQERKELCNYERTNNF